MRMDVVSDDMHVEYHWYCALRCYLLFLAGTSMFIDKSATYVDEVYLKYFTDLNAIHEYKLGVTYLVYLCLKMDESYLWKTKQMTRSCTLLTVISCYKYFHNSFVTLVINIVSEPFMGMDHLPLPSHHRVGSYVCLRWGMTMCSCFYPYMGNGIA